MVICSVRKSKIFTLLIIGCAFPTDTIFTAQPRKAFAMKSFLPSIISVLL